MGESIGDGRVVSIDIGNGYRNITYNCEKSEGGGNCGDWSILEDWKC